MLLQRVTAVIGLMLLTCSFVSAKYIVQNGTLYNNENKKVVPDSEYLNVLQGMYESNDATDYEPTIAEWLLDNGLEVNVHENLPIRCAARFGHTALVLKLIDNPNVDPTAKNNEVIRYASGKGDTVIVKRLLKNKINKVDSSAGYNYTIQDASQNGHIEIVKLLLKDPSVHPGADDNEAIRSASQNGHSEIVKLLLKDKRVDPGAMDNEAIRFASEYGHSETLQILLKDRRVTPAAKDNYAIRWASRNGHSKVIILLLNDSRVDPGANNNQAMTYASENGHSEVVKLLLNDGRVNPAANDNIAIEFAAFLGHAAVVELLLTNSSVDASKALEIAIEEEFYGIVAIINKARPKLFIDKNVSIDKKVLNLAKKTIQVKTTISVENSKLIIHYESEYDYEATFVLTSLNDDSTIYSNVFNISNGELSIELNKLKSNEWNWRWICAKQTIENTGKFIKHNSNLNDEPLSNEESKVPIWLILFIVASAVAFIAIAFSVVVVVQLRRQKGINKVPINL